MRPRRTGALVPALRIAAAIAVATAVAIAAGCRGEAPKAQRSDSLAALVDSLRPAVERVVGLRFRAPTRSAMRTREEVRAYLVHQLDAELPPAKLRGLQAAYRLFGFVPDSLDLRRLLLDLYTEQVAGYYDPDSTILFGVVGADPLQLRVVVAHEMVHALQDQYLSLDSILHEVDNNDRVSAAQAILEGQATVGSIRVLAGGQDVTARPEFWEMYREQVQQQQSATPVFAQAPLLIREGLIFPYLSGAEFMHWWSTSARADTVPFGSLMPASTEQILHPERYARGDVPVALRLEADSTALYEDVLGELEIGILQAQLAGRDQLGTPPAIGWGGDYFRVYGTPAGPALVWYVVWDNAAAAARFRSATGARLVKPGRAGYRAELDTLTIGGRPALRYVIAPTEWERWPSIPHALAGGDN